MNYEREPMDKSAVMVEKDRPATPLESVLAALEDAIIRLNESCDALTGKLVPVLRSGWGIKDDIVMTPPDSDASPLCRKLSDHAERLRDRRAAIEAVISALEI